MLQVTFIKVASQSVVVGRELRVELGLRVRGWVYNSMLDSRCCKGWS